MADFRVNMTVCSESMDGYVICVGCGFDLTENPKIRRNLGTNSKGLSADVRERVLELWKDLLTSGIQGNVVILNNNVKMCRTCFNDYDKFAIKQADLKQRLQVALRTLNLSQLSEQER